MEAVIAIIVIVLIIRWLAKKGRSKQALAAHGSLTTTASKPPFRAPAAAPRPAAPQVPTGYRAYSDFSEPDPTPARHNPAQQATLADGVWQPGGSVTNVAGYAIHGGLLYVGRQLPGATTVEPDPALINPDLKVDTTRPDWTGEAMSYWPSYSKITPRSRAAYLAWLAGGRSAPEAALGYVFLYFYGLERRILVDSRTSPAAAAELPRLLAEVERLLSIYGENYSFRGYASGLLGTAAALAPGKRYESAPPQNPNAWSSELPLQLKLGLGQLIAEGKPIPLEWALAWLRWSPQSRLRTPATRCPGEFVELFTAEYRNRFGDGMVLKPNKTQLRLDYRPASAGFRGTTAAVSVSGVPDVGTLTTPLSKLADIAEAAMSALDPYSRYLGRNPEAAGTPAALALLPSGVTTAPSAEAEALWAYAETALAAKTQTAVPATELISRWPGQENGKLPKNEALLLGQLLERRGIGMEPDPRFGGAAPAPGSTAVLFRRGSDAVSIASPTFAGAVALLQLTAAVALADGTLAEAEEQLLNRHVVAGLGLNDDEQLRLRAHLTFVMAHPPTPAALRRRLATLPEADRADAGQLLIAIAAADGQVTPPEVDVLVRLFAALGLDESRVYSELHSLTAPGTTGLAAAKLPGTPAERYAVPKPQPETQDPRPAVLLDLALVKAKLEETGRVAALLHEIFVDDEATLASAPAVTAAPMSAGAAGGTATLVVERIGSLDAAHSTLFRQLTAQPQWRRAEFEALAGQAGLLPDGALDTLNEAALDVAGEPMCEGADPIVMNEYALKEMQA